MSAERLTDEEIAEMIAKHSYACDPQGFQDSVVMTCWHAQEFARAAESRGLQRAAEISRDCINGHKRGGTCCSAMIASRIDREREGGDAK